MNIYVSNLDFSVQENDLQKLFEPFGEVVSTKVITDRETGRSRGFGFVEMSSREDADKAVASLNNSEMNGRALTVNEAREKEKSTRRNRLF